MLLDDESDVADLSDVLELSTDDTDRLRRNLAAAAGRRAVRRGRRPDRRSGDAPHEPALLARLREAGFIEYRLPDGVDGDVGPPAGVGTRIVFVDRP